MFNTAKIAFAFISCELLLFMQARRLMLTQRHGDINRDWKKAKMLWNFPILEAMMTIDKEDQDDDEVT